MGFSKSNSRDLNKNNELINKDIKHFLLTNLIICVNMQKEISKAEYLAGRQHSPDKYFSER